MRNLLVVFGFGLMGVAALGDGGMFVRDFGPTTPLVSSPAQEALLVRGEGEVTVVLRTHFAKGPKELAWLVPVPSAPISVSAAKEDVFTRLSGIAAPRFYAVERKSKGMNCGCAAEKSMSEGAAEAVTVHSTGTAGVFEYHTLTATEPQKLIDWLKENGYRVPETAAGALRPYVEKKFAWIAMKIRPEESEKGTLAPHPVMYRYKSESLVFPMEISRVSAAAETEVILYVIAPKRHRAGNWENASVEQFKPWRAATASGTNYEQMIREETAKRGRLFVTEYAARLWSGTVDLKDVGVETGGSSPAVLTRLRALVAPGAMDRDVELVGSEETKEILNSHRMLSSAGVDVGTASVFMVGVGWVYFLRRK